MLSFSRLLLVIMYLFSTFIAFVTFGFNTDTSGISKIEYKVKWCNPVFGCKTGYFKSLSAVVGPKPTDGFKEDPNFNFKTICTNCASDTTVKKLFNNLKLKGEGVYTITVRVYDKVKYGTVRNCDGSLSSSYADGTASGNCSELKLVYKIDKTHPNILSFNSNSTSYPNIDEFSKTLYIGRSAKQAITFDNDANTNIFSQSEILKRGNIASIKDNPFLERGIRKNLRTIYFNPVNFNTDQLTLKLRLYDYFNLGNVGNNRCPAGYKWQNVPGYGEGCYQVLDPDSENCSWNENSIVKNMYLKWGRCGDTNGLIFRKNYLQNHGELAFSQAFENKYKQDCSLVGVTITSFTETEKIKKCLTLLHRKFWSQCNNGEYLLKTNLCKYNSNFNSSNENNYYTSKLSKIELYGSSHNLLTTIKDNINLENFVLSYTTKMNDLFPSQENNVYFIRVRDNAGNFSETPLFVVKDDKPPITLNEFLNTFEFSNGEKIFYTIDKKGPPISGKKSIPTKFFAANNNLRIKFSISDKKLGADNTANSGLLKFKLKIENYHYCNEYNVYNFIPSDNLSQQNQTTISQSWTLNHNFSVVDKCLQDQNKTYRYYKAHIISIDDDGNEYMDEICDKVGNCTYIAPLVFRVVANSLDLAKSKIKISTQDNTNYRILANGKDGYIFVLTLKDKFGNKIVPVYSQEDQLEIKSSKLNVSLYNKLFLNQILLNGNRGTFKESLESDEKSSIDGILDTRFEIKENPKNSPNGIYKFKFYSIVPTASLYPWLISGAYLQIRNINFKSKDLTEGNLTKDADIGQFNINQFNGNGSQGPVLSTGNLVYSGVNRYINLDYDAYGKVLYNIFSEGKALQDVGSKQIRLDFASPVIYAFGNLKAITEGVKNVYNYNIWNFDKTTITNNIQLYEKWITNTFYDFYQGTGSIEHKANTIGIIGNNLLGLSKNLYLITSLNNNLTTISKFVKIIIQPELSDLINTNNNHIAVGTKLIYKIDENEVILPSDGKGVFNNKGERYTKNEEFGDSLKIFRNDFSVDDSSYYDDEEVNPVVKNIKILGQVSNRGNEKTLTMEDKKRNIGGDIKKWKVKNNVLKKVGTLAKSIQSWCNGSELSSLAKFSDIPSNCVVKKGNEIIAFIKGNVVIDNYAIKGFETIVIKDGNLYIKGDIYKTKKNSLLAIAVLNPESFERKSLSYSDIKFDGNIKGFVYINPSVTNIDAYIFAQGSILSYDGNKIYDGSTTTDSLVDKNIYNQLYIRGGVISTNTIGGSRLVGNNSVKYDNKCPWFLKEGDCTVNIAQAFDLIYLRRYFLINSKIYGGPDGKLVPYIPVSIASDVDSYNNNHPYMGGKKYCSLSSSEVDCTKDSDPSLVNIPKNGEKYPLYIEFDPTIQSNTPSIFTP